MSSPSNIVTDPQGNPLRLQNLAVGWKLQNGLPVAAVYSGSLRRVTTSTDSAGNSTCADVAGAAGLVGWTSTQLQALVAVNPSLQALLDAVGTAVMALATAALAAPAA